jgi:hypothetical protein
MKAETWWFVWLIASVAFSLAISWVASMIREAREIEKERQRALAKILQCRPPDD